MMPYLGRYGVWCGVVWCGVVWCGVVWSGVVWSGGGVGWGEIRGERRADTGSDTTHNDAPAPVLLRQRHELGQRPPVRKADGHGAARGARDLAVDVLGVVLLCVAEEDLECVVLLLLLLLLLLVVVVMVVTVG